MATPEATLRAAVLKRIREDYPPSKSQVLVFGRPAGPATGPGHPDLFGVAAGRFLALEIKVRGSQPTPLQVQRIQDLRRAGAYAWVVRSTLDATRAVYQAKIGGLVPNPNDPIDFDAWFQSVTNQTDQPVDPEPVQAKPQDTTETVLQAAAEAGIPVAEPVVETPYQEMPLHNGTDLPFNPTPQAASQQDYLASLTSVIAHQTDVLKTVGDRVTECYEAMNRTETNQRHTHHMLADLTQEVISLREVLNKLLVEVGADDQIDPPLDEPTPLDDVLPEEPPARKNRRRRAS